MGNTNEVYNFQSPEDLDGPLPESVDEEPTKVTIDDNIDTEPVVAKSNNSKAEIVANIILEIIQERLQNTDKPLTMKTIKALKEFATVRAIILQNR